MEAEPQIRYDLDERAAPETKLTREGLKMVQDGCDYFQNGRL